MGWLDSIFGGLSEPDYNKMFEERMMKEQQEREIVFDYSKSTAEIKEWDKERSVSIKKSENKEHKEKARKEKKKEEKAAADLKLVIDGAKIQCTLCANPIGDLKVNFDTPTIQNKKTATVKEKDKKSLIFKGNCSKSPQSSSPCASVMQLDKWKDVGTSKVQDQFPLLLKSTIKCNYGGTDIKIIDCGQKNEPSPVETKGAPVPKDTSKILKNKEIISAVWMNADMNSEIKTASIDEKVSVFVKTKNYMEGDIVSLEITEVDGKDVTKGVKKVMISGIVKADGSAELQEKIEIELV
jgi:hypothetical protein